MRQIDVGVLRVANMVLEVLIVSFKAHHPQDAEDAQFRGLNAVMHVVMHYRLEVIDGHASFKKGKRTNEIALGFHYFRNDDGRGTGQNPKNFSGIFERMNLTYVGLIVNVTLL